jgi:hypothetical protein
MTPFAEPLDVEPVGLVVSPVVVRLRLLRPALLTRLTLQSTSPDRTRYSAVRARLLRMTGSPSRHGLGALSTASRRLHALPSARPNRIRPELLRFARDAGRMQAIQALAIPVEERRCVRLHLPAASTRLSFPPGESLMLATEILHASSAVLRMPRIEAALLASRLKGRITPLVGREVLPSRRKLTLTATAPLRLGHPRSILQG